MNRLSRFGKFVVVVLSVMVVLWALELGVARLFHYVMRHAEF